MRKKTYVGEKDGQHCFIEWELKGGKFSASGYYLNRSGSDHCFSGQVLDDILADFPDNEQVRRIHSVWKRWHLNDMRAGSPKQQELIDAVIAPEYEKIKQDLGALEEKYQKVRRILFDRINDSLVNIHQRPEGVLEALVKFLKASPIKEGKPNHYLVTRGGGIEHSYLLSKEGRKSFSVSWGEAQTITNPPKPLPSRYEFICNRLVDFGRLYDPDYIVDDKAYKYGTRWLKEELPQEVIDEVNSWVEVSFNRKTPIQKLAGEYVKELKFKCVDKEVSGRTNYTLTLIDGTSFSYFCGSPSDVTPEAALSVVLRDAYAGKDGIEAAVATLVDEFGMGGAKEVITAAMGCVDSYNKLVSAGVWSDEVEDLATGM